MHTSYQHIISCVEFIWFASSTLFNVLNSNKMLTRSNLFHQFDYSMAKDSLSIFLRLFLIPILNRHSASLSVSTSVSVFTSVHFITANDSTLLHNKWVWELSCRKSSFITFHWWSFARYYLEMRKYSIQQHH